MFKCFYNKNSFVIYVNYAVYGRPMNYVKDKCVMILILMNLTSKYKYKCIYGPFIYSVYGLYKCDLTNFIFTIHRSAALTNLYVTTY